MQLRVVKLNGWPLEDDKLQDWDFTAAMRKVYLLSTSVTESTVDKIMRRYPDCEFILQPEGTAPPSDQQQPTESNS